MTFGIDEKVLEQVILKCLREEQVVKGCCRRQGEKGGEDRPVLLASEKAAFGPSR